MDETTTETGDFDLDVTFAEKGTVISELMNKTSNNCAKTQISVCIPCMTD